MHIYQKILKCETGEIAPADLYKILLAIPGARGYIKNPDFNGGYNKKTYVSLSAHTLSQYTYSAGSADVRFCDNDRTDIFVNIPCGVIECLLNVQSPLRDSFEQRPFAVFCFDKPVFLAKTAEDAKIWATNNGYHSAVVDRIEY